MALVPAMTEALSQWRLHDLRHDINKDSFKKWRIRCRRNYL